MMHNVSEHALDWQDLWHSELQRMGPCIPHVPFVLIRVTPALFLVTIFLRKCWNPIVSVFSPHWGGEKNIFFIFFFFFIFWVSPRKYRKSKKMKNKCIEQRSCEKTDGSRFYLPLPDLSPMHVG